MIGEERITFSSGGLRLEGQIAVPEGAARAAVICHPHPQYGGDMDNPVVRSVTDRLQRAGYATLRFNFPGVGASEGSYSGFFGETEDARAALAMIQSKSGVGEVALVGYSFGALISLLVGQGHPAVREIVAVGLPTTMFEIESLAACCKPKLFVLGDRDRFCSLDALEALVASLSPPKRLVALAGADHFFTGFESRVAETVARFLGAEG